MPSQAELGDADELRVKDERCATCSTRARLVNVKFRTRVTMQS
jgi:hypothetical protein